MRQTRYEPFSPLVTIAVAIAAFLLLLVGLLVALLRVPLSEGFGSTVNVESHTISIYLDAEELPTMTAAQLKTALCEKRFQATRHEEGPRPPSRVAPPPDDVPVQYEVYRRSGNGPTALLTTFRVSECFPTKSER